MRIFVDADACPVVPAIIDIAATSGGDVILVKSYAHYSHEPLPGHVEVVYVDHGNDQADFRIVQLTQKSDLVVTQDYGLASLCLKKGCLVIHHNGMQYTEQNIDRLLEQRHISAMARKSGQRTKGPKKYTKEQEEKFIRTLTRIIQANE